MKCKFELYSLEMNWSLVLIEAKWNVNYSHEYNRPAYIAVVVFDDCEIQIYYIECKFEYEYGDWEESYRFISSVQKLTY